MIHSLERGRILRPTVASAAALLSAALLLPPSARAADVSCQPVADTMKKMVATPTHIYSTTTAQWRSGAPRQTETIYAGGAIYTKVGASWMRSQLRPAEMLDASSRDPQGRHSCRYLRDEAVNGEAAAVYSTHFEARSGKIDTEIWVSKGKGLPLRQETDIDVGGAAGKSHRSDRYEYGIVQPPKL
jgi:hypothetical protein